MCWEGSFVRGLLIVRVLAHDYLRSGAEEQREADGVPVGEADAAGTEGAADGFGIVRSVEADAWLVDSGPENAHGVVWSGWE